MDNSTKKGSRGGKREGAGRPGTDSKLYTFRAPKGMAEYIDAQDNKTDFIKNCIAKSIVDERTNLEKLGTVYSATQIKEMNLPYFDIGIVAGFPIPLDNDEKAQDIELLKMLCPNPESCYLIRVEGYSMIDAGIHSGDIVIVDKSNRNPSESQVAVCEFNGDNGGYGHVALVTDVEHDQKIQIQEANYNGHRYIDNFRGWFDPTNPVWGTVTYIIHKPRH